MKISKDTAMLLCKKIHAPFPSFQSSNDYLDLVHMSLNEVFKDKVEPSIRPDWLNGQIISLLDAAMFNQNKEEYAEALYLAGCAYSLANSFGGDDNVDRAAMFAAKSIKAYCTDKIRDWKECAEFEKIADMFKELEMLEDEKPDQAP